MTKRRFLRWLRLRRAQILIYGKVNSGFPRAVSLPAKKSSFIHDSPKYGQVLVKQDGWLMPVAAFIVVAMGIMAAALMRSVSQESIGGAQEAISVQTFYAAESGAQYAMNRLFYDTASPITPTAADAGCASIDGNTINFNAAGMVGCQTALTCSPSVDAGTNTHFYQISSDAFCQVGDVTAQRIVDVSAFLQ